MKVMKEVVFYQFRRFRHNSKMFYYFAAVMLFIAGLLIGANCFKQNSNSYQIPIVPISAVVDQDQAQAQSQISPQPAAVATTTEVVAPLPPTDNTKLLTVTVRHKDSLTRIFKRNGIDVKDAKAILALKRAKALRDLRAGKKIELTIEKVEKGTKLKQLVYVIDELDTLTVVSHNGWHAQIKHIEPTVKISYAAATVHGSVYTAASKHGISHKIVAQLANIFSKKADLRKMHQGDSFAVLYKEYSVNGKTIKEGEVVAAEILQKGHLYRMIGFTDHHGNTDYYNPEGYNSNPPFARLPITNYSHIGSRFSRNRYHPILGYSRPHNGVDFSAPFGTPIKATSNGKVEFVGSHGQHGRTVIIQRGIYKTLYAHMSKFASGICSGCNVKKGQTIGFVGASGLATGSHLHYEFHVNGVPHDPLKVKLPEGEMIPPEHRKSFFAFAKRILTQLDAHRNSHRMVAMNNVSELSERKEFSV